MDITEIKLALEQKFNAPLKTGMQRHIVFWYDEEKSFENRLEEIIPENAKLHILNDNYFTTKYLVEKNDVKSNLLIYSPACQPPKEQDWLYDIYKYSQSFSADTVTLIMNELRLDRADIRGFIKENKSFFDSQDRFKRLKDLCSAEWTIDDLKQGMMAVACRIKHISIEEILKSIFNHGLDEDNNKYWQSVLKWPGKSSFFYLIERAYGYSLPSPNLKTLLISLMVTDLTVTSSLGLSSNLEGFKNNRRNNCRIFIDHWINHSSDYEDYENLSADMAEHINIKTILDEHSVDDYSECETFEYIDKSIIIYLTNALIEGLNEYEKYLNLISIRRSKHWFSKFRNIYDALDAAIRLLLLKSRHPDGFPEASPFEMIQSYAEEYCKFDRYYRDFYFYSDQVENDILKKALIPQIIEPLYKNWYLDKLSNVWHPTVKKLVSSNWSVSDMPFQADFYKDHVKTIIDSTQKDKIFVIISDALRYESGVELEAMLNRETRSSTTITPMLGVVPSYTSLGMAALLPHESIKFKINSADSQNEHSKKGDARVYVNDIDSSSTGGREKILKSAYSDSIALKLNTLIDKSRDDARDLIKDSRVIYLYHNVIDAIGDDAKTEKKTFKAVRECLDELFKAVKKIVGSLNGTRILITADHGFLYNRDPLAETDKLASISNVLNQKDKQNLNTNSLITSGRRFAIFASNRINVKNTNAKNTNADNISSNNIHENNINSDKFEIKGTQSCSMNYIIDEPQNAAACFPNGNIRFAVQGAGSLFVHGGTSLQEVVIPLIQFHNIRKQSKKNVQSSRPVKVELTTPSRKITNNRFNLSFFQKEKVEGKLKPLTMKILLKDEETATQISDERTIIADRTQDDPQDRVFKLTFTLKGQSFDKTKTYYLKMIDTETGLEMASIPFTISIAIVNDFDF